MDNFTLFVVSADVLMVVAFIALMVLDKVVTENGLKSACCRNA